MISSAPPTMSPSALSVGTGIGSAFSSTLGDLGLSTGEDGREFGADVGTLSCVLLSSFPGVGGGGVDSIATADS